MGIPFASLILSSSSLTDKNLLITIYLVCELVMSLLTAFFYKLDKEKAKRGQWRTKEKTLLLLPWLMGGVGGFLGVYVLRHKTRHWYFVFNNVLALILQGSILICMIVLL